MNKEEALIKAEELGIKDAHKLSWNELKHQIKIAQDSMQEPGKDEEIRKLRQQLAEERASNRDLRIKYAGEDPGRAPTAEELKNMDVEIAPEIHSRNASEPSYILNEKLGKKAVYKKNDSKNGIGVFLKNPGDYEYKGDEVIGYEDEQVEATVMGPRNNAKLSLRKGSNEFFEFVEMNGKSGYRWQDVRQHLKKIRNGYYLQHFHERIYGNRSKGLPCQIVSVNFKSVIPVEFVHAMLKEIKEMEVQELLKAEQAKQLTEKLLDRDGD